MSGKRPETGLNRGEIRIRRAFRRSLVSLAMGALIAGGLFYWWRIPPEQVQIEEAEINVPLVADSGPAASS